jgi:aminocarboxymuconate-semialdehyde decarboxylase
LTTIDIHAHAIVPGALAEMASRHPDHGPTLVEEDGRRYLRYPGRERLGPLPEAIFEPELRLADMDRQRVDLQVIAIPPPNFHYHVPPDVGADFAAIQNDALIGLSDEEPDRFHVFATLPLQDVEASLAEIDRVARFPRVRGVQIGSNINGADVDDPALEPVWVELERRNLPVWFHSDQRSIAGAERLNSYYLQNLIGIPLESTIAAAKLIFGGVLDRHPGLRIGFTHGGGFAPYQIGRWEHGGEVRPEPKVNIPDDGPRHFFAMMYFDSLTHDAVSLEMLGKRMGWEHVVLGSDYPFDMASVDPVTAVEDVVTDDDDRSLVLEGNAGRFLRPLDQVSR